MDNEINKKLQNAIASKDIGAVEKVIHNSNLYIVDQLLKHKWSLCNVVKLSKPNITKLFLESDDSIDVNEADGDGWTALHEAAYKLDFDHVKLLLDHKADPNSLDTECHTPLYHIYQGATRPSNYILKIAVMFIDRGAKATITRNNVSYLQIQPILLYGDREAVDYVLKLDVNLRVDYEYGNTIVHFLARNDNDEQILTVIRGRDFDVNARNHRQRTPLWCAAHCGNAQAVEFLLSVGADVNIADEDNFTPLYIAMELYEYEYDGRDEEHKTCMALLLDRGADIQIVPTRSDLALFNFDGSQNNIMLEHLALREMNGMKITELMQSKIDLRSSTRTYYDSCKKLLTKKVYMAETTLELLSCSDEKMVLYMRNEEIVRIIKDFCNELKLNSLAYGALLQKRFEKAKATAKLRGEVVPVISKLIKLDYDYYFSIVDMIVRFLNERDLNTLLNV